MKFEQTVELDAPVERVWAFVNDVPSVAKCIPGLQSFEDLGNDRYKAVVRVKVGPIALNLASELSIESRDEASKTATIRVEAADKRVGGAVKALMNQRLEANGTGTRLFVETDAQVMGRIGDFGQPVIRKKADQTLQEVAANLRAALATPA